MELENKIPKKALRVWRITGTIKTGIGWLLTAIAFFLIRIFHWPFWISVILTLLGILFTFLNIYLFPLLRWRYWRYEVREQEIELQEGIMIKRRTLVPMVRVQHVDTIQGPILRKHHLASIRVHTAATTHEIPALEEKEADNMRVSISSLAKVAENDV